MLRVSQLFWLTAFVFALCAQGQKPAMPEVTPMADRGKLLVPRLGRDIAHDQALFWNLPAQLRTRDLTWIAPLAGVAAAVVASDTWLSKQVPGSRVQSSQKISDRAAFSLIGLGAGSFFLGKFRGDDHLAEAGLLSGEAAIDSTAAVFVLKEGFRRERPNHSDGHGAFFHSGNSFPSEHAATAWSIASVWAHEYPGALSQILAYGLATVVTVTRVTGHEHFASDAIV